MRTTHSFLAASSALALAACCAIGCSDSSSSSSSSSSGGPDAGGDTGPIGCLTTGRLSIAVSGLPAGVDAKVKVTGASGAQDVAASKDLDLAVGDYTIAASDVAAPDAIARTMYHANISTPSSTPTVTLCSGPVSVNVVYAPIASSGKVWMGNANGTAPTLGYAASALGATATVPATVAAKTRGGRGMAFDKDGNLWTIGGTTVDPTISRYPAASLAASGEPTADRKIDVKNSGCSPSAFALAFDKDGNLWLSQLCDQRIVRLRPSDLAADGEVDPTVAIGNVPSPKGLAFDKDGNLWVSANTVQRFDASRLGASTSDPANAVLTLDTDSEYVAFDASGDLWSVGGSDVNLIHVAKADLGGTGASTPTAASSISVGVGALPEGIAFDESGGLWIATSAGKFARLAPSQLATSTTYADPTVPERVFTSDDVGSAGTIAIFPAPAALPLYHRAD